MGAPVFIQLGRYGDLIQLLPAWYSIFQRTQAEPIVMVSTDYADLFDGVSYIQPFPIHGHWFTQVPFARDLAKQHFGGAIIPQWWHETDRAEEILKEQSEGATVLQCHGINWGVDMAKNPNYGTSMWWRCGFTPEEMMTLPLVFDKRDLAREQRLAETYFNFKQSPPIVLYNFTGISSPFAFVPEVMKVMLEFSSKFKFVDLGKVRAQKIFDVIGLMDRAIAMITIDTATLHLAPASQIRYLAYTVDGWSKSVPKGNCVFDIPYSQTLSRLHHIREFLAAI